jgi:hypothetical protein
VSEIWVEFIRRPCGGLENKKIEEFMRSAGLRRIKWVDEKWQ